MSQSFGGIVRSDRMIHKGDTASIECHGAYSVSTTAMNPQARPLLVDMAMKKLMPRPNPQMPRRMRLSVSKTRGPFFVFAVFVRIRSKLPKPVRAYRIVMIVLASGNTHHCTSPAVAGNPTLNVVPAAADVSPLNRCCRRQTAIRPPPPGPPLSVL